MSLVGQIFTLQPWRAEFGDPTNPSRLLGVEVNRCVLRRGDGSELLVSLADRRFALTGSVLAAGSAPELALYLRQRAASSRSEGDRQWLRSAADALGQRTRSEQPDTTSSRAALAVPVHRA